MKLVSGAQTVCSGICAQSGGLTLPLTATMEGPAARIALFSHVLPDRTMKEDYVADDLGEPAFFKMITAHGTEVAADPISGVLIHAPEDSGIPVVGRRVHETVALLGRADGNHIAGLGTVPGEVVRAYPVVLDADADASGMVIRLPGRRLLTATPGGEINFNRRSIGGWEFFRLEPIADLDRSLLSIDHTDASEAFYEDPQSDPAILAASFARLPAQQRQRLTPTVVARADYERVFPLLRAILSAGAERSYWHTQSRLREGITSYGWVVGDHTYGAPTIVDGQYGSLEIGRYCSIAGEVRIVLANHAIGTVTTYPFSALSQFWPSGSPDRPDHGGTGVVIGNSVWIGAGATILPGARIGDGAIVGSMAVVAGRVPPYAVVVGNPARVTRQRFDTATTERLLATRWWDWPDHEVDRVIPLLLADDVSAFLAKVDAQT